MPDRQIPLVLINPKARRGQEWADRVIAALGTRAARLELVSSPVHSRKLLEEAIQSGIKEVWVGGGDGSVRQAAHILKNTEICLGILPLGTGNALAGELGIPADPEKMVDFLLHQAKADYIDIGQLNEHTFVNVATLGITSKVASALKHMNKGLFGRLAYVPAIAQAAILTRPIPAEIILGDEVFQMSFLQFVAASGAYHGGFFSVTREASITDGLLSVYAVQQAERTSLLRYGFGLVTGTHTDLSEIWSHEAINLTVKTGRVRKWVIDGDIIKTAVAKLSIVPNGLLVLRAPCSP